MKIHALLIFLFVWINHVSAQTNFPGKYPIVLLDKELTVKPLDPGQQKNGYPNFYKEKDVLVTFACCNNGNSKYKSLVNKKFRVSSVDPYTDEEGIKKFTLTLENNETGRLVYNYDPKDDSNFPFEVTGGLEIPPSFYCIDINYKVAEDTGDTLYYSDPEDQVIFTKAATKKGNNYYLKVYGLSPAYYSPGKGVTIFLEEGKLVKKPSEIIKADAVKGMPGDVVNTYMYSAYIILDDTDIELLIKYPITEVKMNFLTFKTKLGIKYMNYLRCLSK